MGLGIKELSPARFKLISKREPKAGIWETFATSAQSQNIFSDAEQLTGYSFQSKPVLKPVTKTDDQVRGYSPNRSVRLFSR
jgi:hypothetical protein